MSTNQQQKDPLVNFLMDVFPDESPESLSREQLDQSRPRVMEAINCLDQVEKDIIKGLYGLGDGYVYTPEETGRIFKMSYGEVKQNQRDAMEKFRTYLDIISSGCV